MRIKDTPARPIPVTYEDVGRAFDDLADQVRALGQRGRAYVQESKPFGERPIISIMLQATGSAVASGSRGGPGA
jgi:hypothetical protein